MTSGVHTGSAGLLLPTLKYHSPQTGHPGNMWLLVFMTSGVHTRSAGLLLPTLKYYVYPFTTETHSPQKLTNGPQGGYPSYRHTKETEAIQMPYVGHNRGGQGETDYKHWVFHTYLVKPYMGGHITGSSIYYSTGGRFCCHYSNYWSYTLHATKGDYSSVLQSKERMKEADK